MTLINVTFFADSPSQVNYLEDQEALILSQDHAFIYNLYHDQSLQFCDIDHGHWSAIPAKSFSNL